METKGTSKVLVPAHAHLTRFNAGTTISFTASAFTRVNTKRAYRR